MLIQDIMKPKVVTIAQESSMEEAYRLLMKYNIHHLVVMENRQVKGVVADSDVASLHPQELHLVPVRQCMSQGVVCVSPETTLKHAAELMQKHHFECLPVCKDRELVGIVTIEYLLSAFCMDIEHLDRANADWCSIEDRPIRWQIHPLG